MKRQPVRKRRIIVCRCPACMAAFPERSRDVGEIKTELLRHLSRVPGKRWNDGDKNKEAS